MTCIFILFLNQICASFAYTSFACTIFAFVSTTLNYYAAAAAAAAVASVVSDSVQPHRWQPTRLCCPWDSPGKNTRVCAISFSNAWKGMWICSVVSDSLRPRGLQPTRLLCPWNYYKCIEIIIHLENWEMHIHLMKITILTSLLY